MSGSTGPGCAAGMASAVSRRPSVTISVSMAPSRNTSTSTALPTAVLPTLRTKPRVSATSVPSKVRITSPASMPASLAGPSGTSVTSAPSAVARPIASATSPLTSWMRTPNQPRRVSPKRCNWSTTWITTAEDMAKPIPIEPPLGDRMAVFTPITSPSMLKSGPPELPRLIAASVWM